MNFTPINWYNSDMTLDTSNTTDFYCDFVLNDKIEVEKEIETDNVLAYHHTRPHWTTHIVVIPKKHITGLVDVEDFEIVKEIFEVFQKLIKKYKYNETNFKILTNGGEFQDSKHLHFHLFAGKPVDKRNSP